MSNEEIKKAVQEELSSIYAKFKWFLYGLLIFIVILLFLKIFTTHDILRIGHQLIFPMDTTEVGRVILSTLEGTKKELTRSFDKIEDIENRIKLIEKRLNQVKGFVEFQNTIGRINNIPEIKFNILGPAKDLNLKIGESNVIVTYDGTSVSAIVGSSYSKQGGGDIPTSEVLGQINLDLAFDLGLTQTDENGIVRLKSNYLQQGMVRVTLEPK